MLIVSSMHDFVLRNETNSIEYHLLLKSWARYEWRINYVSFCCCINSWASWEWTITYVMTVIPIQVHFLNPTQREVRGISFVLYFWVTFVVDEYKPYTLSKMDDVGEPPESRGLTRLLNQRNLFFQHWYLDQWRLLSLKLSTENGPWPKEVHVTVPCQMYNCSTTCFIFFCRGLGWFVPLNLQHLPPMEKEMIR